jgi:hypothetical protein
MCVDWGPENRRETKEANDNLLISEEGREILPQSIPLTSSTTGDWNKMASV